MWSRGIRVSVAPRFMRHVRSQSGVNAQPLQRLPLHHGIRPKEVAVVFDHHIECIGLRYIYRECTIDGNAVIEVGAVRSRAAMQVIRTRYKGFGVLHLPGEMTIDVNVGQVDLFTDTVSVSDCSRGIEGSSRIF